MQAWVVVVDSDDVSKRQMEACRALQPDLKGAIECDDAKNAEAEVCWKVERFPSFCNTVTNECVSGLRDTAEKFSELANYEPK